MDLKALMKKYGVTVGVAGGCLVLGSQYGSCAIDPTPPTPETEEAPAPAAEEPKAEEPAEEAASE